ncbi:molybdopterin-dependent oxidoreductase (plasmid) [Thioclava sp. 'Guangxiensis']|uniref:molybdopterin-dependent oxidoreductase n=1 Tax=Thioclava sp. 'Guangxiensis' TaxID=3149044 RepID=UPI0032C45C28
MRYLKSSLAILAVFLASMMPALAQSPVLTIIGAPGLTAPVELDRAALEALPSGSFTTTTTWTKGPQEFKGVYLADLLAEYGVSEGNLKLTAVNDYSVTVPVSELHPNEALLAYSRNGETMSVRDKGPLWVVYPYDSDEALRNEVVYARSIWQVVKIEILN